MYYMTDDFNNINHKSYRKYEDEIRAKKSSPRKQ